MVEYVKLENSERIYGQKNLLYCEMEILSVIKRYKAYEKLRKENSKVRDNLKKKVKELQDNLLSLDKTLPRLSSDRGGRIARRLPKKRSDLEIEIDEIKAKLASLQ